MHPRYHRSIALFLSIVIAFQSISCAWSPYMEYDMSFDRDFVFNYTKKNTSFNAWYYNADLYNHENLKNQNAQSWADFLEGAYRKEDLISFIYRGESKFSTRDKELLNLRRSRLNPLKSPQKEAQFVDCIVFALKVEKLMEAYTPDPWEDEPKKIVMSDFSPLMNQAMAQITTNQDTFLKERYAFQLLKLNRYSKQYTTFISNFKKYFDGKTSMLSFWAMEHYAGVLSELKRTAEANYYFAKVYVHCPEKRSSSYLSMKLNSPTDFKNTLNLCVNDEEKMALYYIHAMQSKTLAMSDLNEITQKLGNHEYARVVMSHELNKLEKILLAKIDSEEDEEYLSERTKELRLLKNQVPVYINDLIQLNQSMLAQDENDYFWHLSLAYLYYLDAQNENCSKILNEIHPKSLEIQKQYDIIYVINYIDSRSTLSIADENIIGEKMYDINENNPAYPFISTSESTQSAYGNESFLLEEYNTINEFIFRKIAAHYRSSNAFIHLIFSGEVFYDLCVKSTSFVAGGQGNSLNFQIKVADIDRIITDLKRTPESKLSLFAASYYFQTPNEEYYQGNPQLPNVTFTACEQQLKGLKATILMRNPANIDEAISILSTIPSELVNEDIVYGSPFRYSSKTPNFEQHDEKKEELPKMNRLEFAQKVKQLMTQPMTAENAFQLGVAYYNCSYYGLQWKVLAYYRTYSSPEGNVDMRVAQGYLNTALSLGGLNRERQAQAYFMLARCEQNQYTFANGSFPDWDEGEDGFSNYFNELKRSGSMRNFQQLASNYYGTSTYQEIIRECKYFEYYVN
jgi:hypothetical protein